MSAVDVYGLRVHAVLARHKGDSDRADELVRQADDLEATEPAPHPLVAAEATRALAALQQSLSDPHRAPDTKE